MMPVTGFAMLRYNPTLPLAFPAQQHPTAPYPHFTAAFTQEVQYDLSSSNEIGFKKLRINVLSATNTEIVYKLIRNFGG